MKNTFVQCKLRYKYLYYPITLNNGKKNFIKQSWSANFSYGWPCMWMSAVSRRCHFPQWRAR